jgi:hypothetical protein
MLVYQRVYGISMENPPQNGLVDWFESYESARNVDRFLSPSGFSDFTVGEGFRHASTVGLAECLDPHFAMSNGSMISMSHIFFRRTHVELPFIMYYVTWIHLRHYYDNDNTWITLQPTHPCIVIKIVMMMMMIVIQRLWIQLGYWDSRHQATCWNIKLFLDITHPVNKHFISFHHLT